MEKKKKSLRSKERSLSVMPGFVQSEDDIHTYVMKLSIVLSLFAPLINPAEFF